MKLLSRVAVALLQGATLACLCAPFAQSQVSQIEKSKLPQNTAVQQAYSDLLVIDQYARTFETTWSYPVPKADVTSRFTRALRTLQNAQQRDPDNKELELLTGLVAHLAYNLGDEDAADTALTLLKSQAREDFRAAWFLGMHQCQSNDPVAGMEQFLHVETTTPSPPPAFWQDYADCAGIAGMPVHAIRAYDKARNTPGAPPIDAQVEQVARNKIKPSDVTSSYSPKQAWHEEKITGGNRLTSNICGESFVTLPSYQLKIGDVRNGICIVSADTELYPSRYGPSSASLLVMTQAAKPDETLETFSQRILKDPLYTGKTPASGIHCPVPTTCLAYEVVTDKLYKPEGGAHLLVVFFASEQPAYPGLRFETPQPQPKDSSTSGLPSFAQSEQIPQRFNGTLYTFISLDANRDIFPRSRADFDQILKSFIVDTK
jgi:hypothetical protein